MGILKQFWFEFGIPSLVRRINLMSVSHAQQLGASLLRGEGLRLLSHMLSPELTALLEPRHFPVLLLKAVAEAWQRAVNEEINLD